MKTFYVIIYNIALLLLGVLCTFFLLKKVGHRTEVLEYNLTVNDFNNVLAKSSIPDSVLTP